MSPGEGAERLARALVPYLTRGAHDPAHPAPVLLAVSGGPDSTALMHVAASLRAEVTLGVATVDHGLRPESAEEAAAVARQARDLGLAHATLSWRPTPGGGIQAAARQARYRLLAEHAARIGVRLVLTAHTSDDQAETVLMRLLAGSGPAGLAGMRRERVLADGIVLARPFLDVPKTALVAYCEARGLPFLRDPSNTDDRFARARLRRVMPLLSAEGLGAQRLNRLAERLARDEAALSRMASGLFEEVRRPAPPGRLALEGRALLAAPEAVSLRVLDRALDSLRPEEAPQAPRRLERLERLLAEAVLPALAEGRRIRRTLRGVLVEVGAQGLVLLAPAPPRRAGMTPAPPNRIAAASGLLGNERGAAYIGGTCKQ